MSLIGNKTQVKRIRWIASSDHKQEVMYYLQGMVYAWCKNEGRRWFSARDLVGGVNFDWNDTPLQVLYNYHRGRRLDHNQAVKRAGIDVGWLLKEVLSEDRRTFETRTKRTRIYRWIR